MNRQVIYRHPARGGLVINGKGLECQCNRSARFRLHRDIDKTEIGVLAIRVDPLCDVFIRHDPLWLQRISPGGDREERGSDCHRDGFPSDAECSFSHNVLTLHLPADFPARSGVSVLTGSAFLDSTLLLTNRIH